MRRKDREISDFNEIVEVLKRCDACTIAMNDDGYPYQFTLNYGLTVEDERLTLYFHSAKQGKKLGLIAENDKASFTFVNPQEAVFSPDTCKATMYFESVVGRGKIEFVEEKHEKRLALDAIVAKYLDEKIEPPDAVIDMTCIFKLTVEEMTGKHRNADN
ncbi:MAG: pyridoxamine 5'-phosphate oxidase family protein [Actinobacteria bacterium]|nr:pyridoxamine 5'-phosphate oxidase family protein [Actinomycetota bacterium]